MSMKFIFKNIDAVIFDIDGTIVDNIAYHEKAWFIFCKHHSLKLTAQKFRKKFFGKNNHFILQGLFDGRLTKQEIHRYTEEKESLYRRIYLPHIKPISGLNELIKKIRKKGLKIAIASAALKKNRDFVLRHLNLTGKFDLIVGDEHVQYSKPHPEIYQKAAKKLHMLPKRCIAFEDTPAGVESAKKAGMKVIGVLTGYSKKALYWADGTIKSFREIKLD